MHFLGPWTSLNALCKSPSQLIWPLKLPPCPFTPVFGVRIGVLTVDLFSSDLFQLSQLEPQPGEHRGGPLCADQLRGQQHLIHPASACSQRRLKQSPCPTQSLPNTVIPILLVSLIVLFDLYPTPRKWTPHCNFVFMSTLQWPMLFVIRPYPLARQGSNCIYSQ